MSKKELLQNLDVQDLYSGTDQSPKLKNGFKKLRPNELTDGLTDDKNKSLNEPQSAL